MIINTKEALRMLLSDKYISEFESIDGLNQHPKGINFYEWLYQKGLISKEDLQIELDKIVNSED